MNTRLSPTQVTANARLHLGFLDPDATLGRRFGSIGVALAGIATRVAVASKPRRTFGDECDDTVRDLTERVRAHYRLPPGFSVQVRERIPAHAGLGSGTQMALALGTALTRACGIAAPAHELAALLGRARRSGIGLSTFERGGLIVDAGHGAAASTPPLIARFEFPPQWRVVLIFDRELAGLSGGAETAAFRELPPFAERQAAHLCHVALMGLLPAVAEHDFAAFSRAVGEIQAVIGDHFARVQDGRFTSPAVSAAVDYCVDVCGLLGVGQSSWGPTGFVFAPDAATAARVATALETRFAASAALDFQVCSASNHGAEIRVNHAANAARAL